VKSQVIAIAMGRGFGDALFSDTFKSCSKNSGAFCGYRLIDRRALPGCCGSK
jgi:hypothetical protein